MNPWMTGCGCLLLGALVVALDHRQRTMNQKHKEQIMAAIDDLNTALDSISAEVTKIAGETQTLIDELQAANQNPGVDLSAAIAKAQAIQAKLQAVDDLVPDAPAATPDPAPAA